MDSTTASKPLFVFATTLEAAPFLATYENLIITGMGREAVKETLAALEGTYTEIWNIGYAGALSPEVAFGEVYTVSLVGRELGEEIYDLNQKGKRLITHEKPLYDREHGKRLSSKWDLVDMEGFYVVEYAASIGIPCTLIKIVSDHANEETSKTILENAPFLSQKLFEYCNTILNRT